MSEVIDEPTTIGEHGEVVGGPLDAKMLAWSITLGTGNNAMDKNWKNVPSTRMELVEYLCSYATGPKDGACIIQGELVGPQRIAKNVKRNHIVMLDIDTGMTLEELVERVREKGLFAVIWATHSHMKGVTEIPENGYLTWAKKNLVAGVEPDKGVATYLMEEKRYRNNVLGSCVYRGKELMDGGMKLIVHHAPMPKYRVLFFLSEPFDFTAGTSQVEQIDAWKTMYRGLSSWLDIPADASCVDPSRLMYTPRAREKSVFGPGLFETLVVNGALLDVNSIVPNLGADRDASQFTKRVESVVGLHKSDDRQTSFPSELIKFAKDCPDFDVIGFYERYGGDRRDSHGQMDKASYGCPNEDAHTSQSATDQGFFIAVDAATAGWYMGCSHDTCRGASGGDRLWYLAAACAQFGVDYKDLYEFSEKGRASVATAAESVATTAKLSSDSLALDLAIETIAHGASVEEIIPIVNALAKMDQGVYVNTALARLAKNSGCGKVELKHELARVRKANYVQATLDEYGDGAALDPSGVPVAPEDLGEAVTIWEEWGSKTSMKACTARLHKLNAKDPFVFARSDGVAVQLLAPADAMAGNGLRMRQLDIPKWTAILDDLLHFKTVKTGKPLDVNIDGRLASNIASSASLGLPLLRAITRVPVFAPDGTLMTERGYNTTLKLYLDPLDDYLPVPGTITPADVDEACEYLHELVRDVPFSDEFNGVETASQMTDEVGSDGWPKPNWSRGRSSRVHYFAMILQTFVRNMIKGSCPAYHIDKHDHGEGGTLLMNMMSIIVENQIAKSTAMPERSEEVNKTITTALMEGPPLILFDNIPSGKVNSPEIAMAITAGSWKARKLGTNDMIDAPIMNVWAFVGVNLSFHRELLRRNVPMKINSQSTNPAARDKSMFKHNPGEKFAQDNRLELVRACHVLIKNWIQMGRPEDPTVQMHSFTEWARVMGGIFWAAGLEGFMENVDGYTKSSGVDDAGSRAAVEKLYRKWKDGATFTSQEALATLTGSLEGMPEGVPIHHNEQTQAMLFSKYLAKDCLGKTYEVDGKRIQLMRTLVSGLSRYQFKDVPTKEHN